MNLFTVIYKKELVLHYINRLKEEDFTYRQLDVHIVHDPVVVEAEVEVGLLVEVTYTLNIHHLVRDLVKTFMFFSRNYYNLHRTCWNWAPASTVLSTCLT